MRYSILVLLSLLLILTPTGTIAQAPSADSAQEELTETQQLERNLLRVLELEETLREELKLKQKELRSPEAAGRQEELAADIRALSARMEEIRTNFTEIALGVDLSSLRRGRQSEIFSWSEELRDLLGPLIAELREITSRPREISRLKEELSLFQEQKQTAEQAAENLRKLQAQLSNKKLKEPIGELLKEWGERLKSLNAELAITEEKLTQKQSGRRSIGQTFESVISLFFESRGRNLFLAFLTALVVWFSLRYLPKMLIRHLGSRGIRLSHAGKIVQVIGLVTSTIGAMLAFLGMLYVFEDWVLLLISSLLVLGLLWTMKDTLPELWQQLALLLNLGPVREGERVEINGLPWIAQSIGFYCFFTNGAFSTGKVLRLPIQDLLELRSRKMNTDEKLFPTAEGDYVIFFGDKYGRVTFQSPDYVELEGFGGSKYYINTQEFLSAQPRVLNSGFGETITFGIDYQHQDISTEEIPKKLHKRISEEFERVNLSENVVRLRVEFQQAGASSLDIAVVAEFKGEAAGRYLTLPRLIQKACVEACNEHGWVIPFHQLTLHMAEKEPLQSLPRAERA
ncbi:hypothetical protein MRY87_11130 [bacterium]|nr:hypothetical protein [bacterium]